MRPLLLEIEGFGAFRDPVSIDFDDTSFFALVGPTGSGKSTVIDAVCFALYGNVPRYDDARMVAPAISIGALEAKVRLTFELAGMRYVAARVVRRSGARVTTKEARLERLGDHPAVLAGTTTELAPAVEALVGLSFEHFTRCVVLPQGEFARFLHDKPADRQELLVRLLDLGVYERMAQTANRRAKEHELAADLVDHQTTTLIAHDDAALSAAETRAGELAALAAKVAAAEPELARLDAALAAVATAQQAADAIVTALASVVVPPDVRRRGELLSAARRDAQRAEAGHGTAEAALVTAAGQSEVGPDGASLAAQLEIHRRIERGVVKRGEVLAAVETAVRAAAATQEVLSRAERRADAARVALEAGRDLHAAHTLRRHLDEGGVCPVCEQQVTHVPRSDPPLALASAES